MIITIRQATSNDLEKILQLFKETIEVVNANDYSPEQITVWKDGASKRERWLAKISEQYFLLAEINNEVVGFGSITSEGYLDFMYVSKNHQRIGVAQKIYSDLEDFAETNQLGQITSDVSITAKSFFEKQGFRTLQKQEVNIDSVVLANYKMKKQLK